MYIIGVDIGGMSIKCGIVDEGGKILQKFVLPIEKGKWQEQIIRDLGALINENIASSGFPKEEFKGIGIGCPGSINPALGSCDYANNLHWSYLPICPMLKEITGLEARITNDANAAALGEVRYGAAKGKKDVILITLGTGVGGGVVLDGKLFEGNEGKGAELGHMIIELDGRPCTCGRHGCLEAYASVTALISDTQAAMKAHQESRMWDYVDGDISHVNGRTAFECASKGDAAAIEVKRQYVHYLGEGLLNFINIFRPQTIVLGGGLSGQKDNLTRPIIEYLENHGYGYGAGIAPKVEVVVSNLGNDAGILGAASLIA